ncbi:MAG TPA: hypothetical protein VMV69_16510 [Pirellulales bacterium]|nr:hypothetical protein [Pirellulales bacterium]
MAPRRWRPVWVDRRGWRAWDYRPGTRWAGGHRSGDYPEQVGKDDKFVRNCKKAIDSDIQNAADLKRTKR